MIEVKIIYGLAAFGPNFPEAYIIIKQHFIN